MSNYVNYTAVSRSRTLAHYASPYYDPVKAHEYYMRNRELKGRQSTAGLNEEGRSHAAYIKEQINSERDSKLEARQRQYQSDQKKALEDRDKTIKDKLEAKEKEIESHTKKMSSEILRLESKLAGMSAEDKRRNSASIRQEIASLRQENNAKRAELNEKYGVDKAGIQTDYANSKNQRTVQYQSDKKAIQKEATEKYLQELMALNDSGEFKKETKSKATKSSSSQNGPVKTTGTLYKSKRLKQILAESRPTSQLKRRSK